MPLQIPKLDDRRYQDLLDEALARIPGHNPEWTNFNKSDPGVTLIEVFAFLTENLLFRSNQIPERNHVKFLKLLGIPLQPASAARGLVTFSNERGPLETITLSAGLEVRAGQVPFRTEQGLDVLPIEAAIFYKRTLKDVSTQLTAYYNQLYASFLKPPLSASAQLYEAAPFPSRDGSAVDLGQEAIDGSMWIALMVRAGDKPAENTPKAREDLKEDVRQQIAGKTLNLGIVPSLADAQRTLLPGGRANPEGAPLLRYEIPVGGTLSNVPSERVPQYRLLEAISATDVLARPGIVQITLPPASQLNLWDNLDPLESGVLDFPPALEDTRLSDRIITWIRVRVSAPAQSRLLWMGINTTNITQHARISNEVLPQGTGTPDQSVALSRTPVIPQSVRLTVTIRNETEEWKEIDDLTSAGPEVPTRDPRMPPGTPVIKNDLVKVYTVNAESGEIRFGDGLRGARPPIGATLKADYHYSVGRDGNVNAGSINSSPALPAGIKVTNPVATWGGAESEKASEGEKQIALYLQHRDRLVNVADFETITLRTPGVDIGRVDVVPAFTPELGSSEPGDAPGAITLMVIPKFDPDQPDAPLPNRLFLDTIYDYIDARRLITTQVFLRGPVYRPIWISAGINVVSGSSIAVVREAVKRELLNFLSPLPVAQDGLTYNQAALVSTPQYANGQRGWPLRKPVVALELMAVASRVPGVALVNKVLLAEGTGANQDQLEMMGLQLPRVMGISVSVGEPLSIDDLRGKATQALAGVNAPGSGVPGDGTPGAGAPGAGELPILVPVPVIPEEC